LKVKRLTFLLEIDEGVDLVMVWSCSSSMETYSQGRVGCRRKGVTATGVALLLEVEERCEGLSEVKLVSRHSLCGGVADFGDCGVPFSSSSVCSEYSLLICRVFWLVEHSVRTLSDGVIEWRRGFAGPMLVITYTVNT